MDKKNQKSNFYSNFNKFCRCKQSKFYNAKRIKTRPPSEVFTNFFFLTFIKFFFFNYLLALKGGPTIYIFLMYIKLYQA
jgi:hypothetical protein